MSWNEIENKPKRPGRYLIHVLQSPYISFGGLEKMNHDHYISAQDAIEFVTEAEFGGDAWKFYDDNGDRHIILGAVKTMDGRDSIYQLKIIEWMDLPSFIPVATPYEPFRNIELSEKDFIESEKTHRMKIDPRIAAFDNIEIAELVKRRYEACKVLYSCKYNKKGNTEYVEISNEKQYKALLDYYTTSRTDGESGAISFTEPQFTGYEGDGIYRIKRHESNMILNMDNGKTKETPEVFDIKKIDNVTEMFHAM